MSLEILTLIALVLAGVPCGLFLLNLRVYRAPALPGEGQRVSAVSVLVPARNEERNIEATLQAALASHGVEFEVIVLDDHSTDRTAAVVSAWATQDARVRLAAAPPLPDGWCGKQHACWVLAGLARHPHLVFLDADVRLAPDALARMSAFLERRGAGLASGVPRQELCSFAERLLLPFIHFLLLGFLPMHFMRWFRGAAFGTGCGQLFVARADAYRQCGGHGRIRATLHDGLKLPKVFRRAGFHTDLFDATPVASCRMYRGATEVWQGLGKNAVEGMAAPAVIGPMTALLLGGQVLPFGLLAIALMQHSAALPLAAVAVVCAWLPRWVAVSRFRQSAVGALAHPVGVLVLLVIQWLALARWLIGRPARWKGRAYGGPVSSLALRVQQSEAKHS